MRLVFIHGPAASGKLTVARELAALTGLPLFHNHLVVDALLAVFPFGSPPFVELREAMWMDVFRAAAADGRSLIFTFHPEASVAPDFPERVVALVEAAGGRILARNGAARGAVFTIRLPALAAGHGIAAE